MKVEPKIDHTLAAVCMIATLLGVVTMLPLSTQVTYAQGVGKSSTSTPIAALNTTSSTSKTSKTPLMPIQGKSIKVFNVQSFVPQKQWQLMDNLTSNGWEIKAIIPRANSQGHITAFTVVLETRR
jgi:hypothetical protein